MKFKNTKKKRVISFALVILIVGGLIPSDMLSGFFGLFAPVFASAADNNAPAYQYMNELYDGSDAISPLPTYIKYKEQTGYTEPKRISLTDFREIVGEALLFNNGTAQNYMSQGYKLMICNAEELYLYSQIVNGKGSSPSEVKFYLSANIVLGDNIEYSEVSYNERYFLPIGGDGNPFTGTFDGQGFEIRDLYFDTEYTPVTVGFFGVVGANAVVRNFGIYHPTIDSTNSAATFTAVIASRNYGTIDDVYAIAQEVQPEKGAIANVNVVKSANSTAGGLVAINYASGKITDSYFAGMLDAREPVVQNPVCPNNSGTISNCYYDSDIFKVGTTPNQIDNPDEENIIPRTNFQLKTLNGVTGTEFKPLNNKATRTGRNTYDWTYPRIYGFIGMGTESDPLIISTPAQLIHFPCSYEYTQAYYFKIDKCIDMNEVAPNAYKPKLDITVTSNYISGGRWINWTVNSTNASFYGKLIGTADDGDENCPIHHTSSLGNDSNGEKLRDNHIILNLTINTPATTTNSYSKSNKFTALIAQSTSNKNIQYNSCVKDLSFVGGEISSGDADGMPTTNTDNSLNVRSATVVAHSNDIDMENVHSSATVKLGTGSQRSTAIGGLIGGGAYHFITDCTNSGDIIGGALEMVPNIFSYNVRVGGLLGAAGTGGSTQWGYYGKLTHVANYGNVYGAYMITDESNDWKLINGSFNTAGITTNQVGSSVTSLTTENGSKPAININDSARGDRIANFGNIYDVPVLKNELTGEVIYDENGKPTAEALPKGKRLVNNDSKARSNMWGIGYNIICNSYNEGNFYSVAINKCLMSGIGYMSTIKNTKNGQYYNYRNYNKGNFYMYDGGIGIYGIAQGYTYKSYNCGNIYFYGGTIFTNGNNSIGIDNGGCFVGICGMSTEYSYNAGDVYIAPTNRERCNSNPTYWYTSTDTNAAAYIGVIGTSMLFVEHTTNIGKLTVDLDKNNFDPVYGTSNLTSEGHFPYISMYSNGLGSYNSSYGKINFIPNKKDTNKMIRLSMSGCLRAGYNNWDNNCNYNRNYVDITVDTTEAPDCVRSLGITGIGYNHTTDYNEKNQNQFTFNNNINYGNITVKGKYNGAVTIRTLGYQALFANNNLNLGDVTVDAEITGTLNIYGYHTMNNSTNRQSKIKNIVNGWYDGCYIPDGMKSDEWNEVFNSLDKSRRYGKINISGKTKAIIVYGVLYQYNSYQAEKTENLINNGEINLTNLMVEDSNITVYAVSNSICYKSRNYAPMTIRDSYFNYITNNYNVYLNGGLSGENNINFAPITVENCVNNAKYKDSGLYLSGITHSGRAIHSENRGKITVRNLYTANVNGTEYISSWCKSSGASGFGWYVHIGGIRSIGGETDYCVNYADISVENADAYHVGGIVGYVTSTSAISNSINYGDININESGGEGFVGGIVGYVSVAKFTLSHCYNFANVNVTNPTSYSWGTGAALYMGGVAGFLNAASITQSENFGKLYYNNDKPYNTDNTNNNTRKTTMCIGGIVGNLYHFDYINSVLNYGDIEIGTERNRNATYVGGIIGFDNSWNDKARKYIGYNMINYGNISVNYLESGGLYAGGIMGYTYPYNTNSLGPRLTNGINYGTVGYKGDNKNNKIYVGSILGLNAHNRPIYLNNMVDLSEAPEGVSDYPIVGGYTYAAGKIYDNLTLYTKNKAAYDSNDQNRCKLKLVTLDKTDTEDTVALYSNNFVFRKEIIHELTDYDSHQRNAMAYQDYDNLSPYLQAYLTSRFGDEVKSNGAYVIMDKAIDEYRSVDVFMPRRSRIENSYNNIQFGVQYDEKSESACFDSSLVNDNELNSLYSSMVSPSERTLQKDFDIYAQQIKDSSLDELIEYKMQTKWEYTNNDTTYYQFFDNYLSDIETHYAQLSDGTYSDKIKYTDINIYMSIDDIDSSSARRKVRDSKTGKPIKDDNGNTVYENVDTDRCIYISPNIERISQCSSMKFYQGDTVDTTKRLKKMNHYTDPYPKNLWLNGDNLDDMLSDESVKWSESMSSYEAKYIFNDTCEDIADRDMWEIAVPYRTNNDLDNMYTKVLGVITAEDGIHKNIVVVHVVIDKYKPYAKLDSVSLDTPSDKIVTSTTDNGGLEIDPDKHDSVTDKDKTDPSKPAQDVIYYYVSDNYKDANGNGLQGENIQSYKSYSSSSNKYPKISVTTYNMSKGDKIWASVFWQDRLPSAENISYNQLKWNDDANHYKSSYKVEVGEVEYDEDQKSTGKVEIDLNSVLSNSECFYGGLYKVNLMYERTKNSDSGKHFATVYFCKEYSPLNAIQGTGWGYISLGGSQYYPSPTTYTRYWGAEIKVLDLLSYDKLYGKSADGYQQGLLFVGRPRYGINPLGYYYCTKKDNDATKSANSTTNCGTYMSLKSSIANNPTSTYYVDADNPIYNKSEEIDEEVDEIPKGKPVTLENVVEKIYVKNDTKTGAYYPAKYIGHTDVMAENGDIRRYTYEQIHMGDYGKKEDGTAWGTYENEPKVTISSATKNGYTIFDKNDDGSYVGKVLGNETSDITFTAQWGSSNVSLDRTDNAVYSDAKYSGSGYAADRIKIYFKGISSDDYTELTKEQINKYFQNSKGETGISVTPYSVWTFILKNDAPVGTYKIVPYFMYRMDFTDKTVNNTAVKLYDYDTGEYLENKDALNFTWTIPYSVPFIIENLPNDETYIKEFKVNNQQYTPFILENSNIEGADSRDVTILKASESGEIVYTGYENVMTGDNRVDTFNVFSYVKKDQQESKITLRVPYKAKLQKYTGKISGEDSYPSFSDSKWESADAEEILVYDEDGNVIENNYKQYTFTVNYNAYDEEAKDYSYSPSVTYYKSIAEDGKTETLYKVSVVPGVRNKSTTLEVAQEGEIEKLGGEDEFKAKMTKVFQESDAMYKEIIEKYGMISATIKELNGSEVDVYQTKYLSGTSSGESEPYVYNLKSFAYDISVDLPAGYTYDVLVFSQSMDNANTLKNSQNGFDGKQLILSSSSNQDLNVRIVIKRDTSSTIWGVEYIWNMNNAAKDGSNIAILGKGGIFNNYVYRRETN